MKPIRYFISVDYDETNQESYRGINLTLTDLNTGEEEELKFNTGDISIDYIDMYVHLTNDEKYELVVGTSSSSLNHFTMDGDKYKWAVLTGNWEQIVPVEINTVDEMRAYYKEKKKVGNEV